MHGHRVALVGHPPASETEMRTIQYLTIVAQEQRTEYPEREMTPIRWADLRLQDRVGEGHAGEVWKALVSSPYRDLSAGSIVAVKRYKKWVLQEPGQYERVWKELEAGRSIRHQNVVKSYCVAADADGLPVLVMEFCDGETLESYLERHRNSCTPPLDESFEIIGALARGVAAIHRAGFIHRDLK